uniref:Carbonic anhydrase n=1 Tax=Globodera pallida TaxID=36090 RepID=A0A183BX46_GLOPA
MMNKVHFLLLVQFLLSALIAQNEAATTWGFEERNGPSTWGGRCQTGTRQSPINIKSEWFSSKADKLTFGNYDQSGPITLVNNGHSVVVLGFDQWPKQPYITGGGLGAKYVLHQFHFHWAHSLNGSEHTVDGQFYEAELHLVHGKEGLSFAEALAHSDGLAVLGKFLELQNGTTPTSMDVLEGALGQVVNAGASVQLDAYNIGLHLPPCPGKYFRYNGSLTTPYCEEVVVWTVFAQPAPITPIQVPWNYCTQFTAMTALPRQMGALCSHSIILRVTDP